MRGATGGSEGGSVCCGGARLCRARPVVRTEKRVARTPRAAPPVTTAVARVDSAERARAAASAPAKPSAQAVAAQEVTGATRRAESSTTCICGSETDARGGLSGNAAV